VRVGCVYVVERLVAEGFMVALRNVCGCVSAVDSSDFRSYLLGHPVGADRHIVGESGRAGDEEVRVVVFCLCLPLVSIGDSDGHPSWRSGWTRRFRPRTPSSSFFRKIQESGSDGAKP